jgi:elongation factor G
MKREDNVKARVGRPRVAYRETLTKAVREDTTYKKQSGGKGQYARVVFEFSPLTDEERHLAVYGVYVSEEISGGTIPREFIKPALRGIAEAVKGGVLAGYPAVNIKAVLVDGAYHDVDSSEMAFHTAASICFKDAFRRAAPVILEPTMSVEVVAPDDYTGSVVGDLSSRRGTILGMEPRIGVATAIRGVVPLSDMFGYATNLRNITQGRGSFTMEFDKYTVAPQAIADEVIKGQR